MQKMDENPENHLLSLAAQGDKLAYGMLYTKYLDEIYRFVLFKVGSELTAEDITEEAFLKTWERLPKIYKKDGKIDNFRAWLYRTANNLVIDHYRKKKPADNIEDTRPSFAPRPEDIAQRHEISRELTQSIKELDPEYQQIILLRVVNELPHKEIAAIMNITEGNARVLLFRALKKLKEILKEKEGSHA